MNAPGKRQRSSMSSFHRNLQQSTMEDKLAKLSKQLLPWAPNLNIRVEGVKIRNGLSPHKTLGSDQIFSRFLKEMATKIYSQLVLIYQASVEQGQIPKELKIAKVSLVFKKGDKSKAYNYRPVFLAYQIRISACFTCAYKSYLTHVISPGAG